jgi:plasmid stability protein
MKKATTKKTIINRWYLTPEQKKSITDLLHSGTVFEYYNKFLFDIRNKNYLTTKQYKLLRDIFYKNNIKVPFYKKIQQQLLNNKDTQLQEKPTKVSRNYKRSITTNERDILTQLLKSNNTHAFDKFQIDLLKNVLNRGSYSEAEFTYIDIIYKRFGFRPNLNEFKNKVDIKNEKYEAKYSNPVDYKNTFRISEYKKSYK